MSLSKHGPIQSHETFSDPKAYAHHLMAEAGSSFTLGMKLLSKPRREAMFAVYAFCRAVDDIADEPGTREEKLALLNDWRAEINALFEGHPSSLVGRALIDPVRRYDLPKREFLLMIDGMAADADGPVICETMADLLAYTRKVAGTVGIWSIRIFGVGNIEARDHFALNLADAFQLTNVLRDIEEDAEIDRLYLPRDIMRKHGITDFSPQAVSTHPALQDVCREIGKIARDRFNEARRYLKELEGEPTRSARIMMGVYETYLDRMEEVDFARAQSVRSLSKWQKAGLGLRYAFFFPNRPLPAAPLTNYPIAEVEPT